MKRTMLPGLVVASLLVMAVRHLAPGSRSEDRPVANGVQQAPEIVRVGKAPRSGSLSSGFPATAGTETLPGHGSEMTLEHLAPVTGDAELAAYCDSLARDTNEGAIELRRVVRRWAETNGPAAAAWASQLLQSPTHAEVLTELALGWADADLTAALDWAQALPAGKTREAVIEQLGYATARTDAAKALEVAASLEPGRQRDDLSEHAISQWAATDLAAAVQWVDGNEFGPDLRQRLLASVAIVVAGKDGVAAATLAATALTPGEEQDRVAVAIVQRWVQNEPELAAAWVAEFPDTPSRATAVQNLVAFWAAQDREAAAGWLRALPEGSLRAAGMTAYSQVQLSATGFAAPE